MGNKLDMSGIDFAQSNLPIVMIGMMGSGKTHFGRLIAQRLNLDFFDSDSLIEQKAGCSVSEIFERWGEAKFREVEAATIQEYLGRGPLVLATGGGAITNPNTADSIFTKSVSIWVQADMSDILARVSKNKNRPLLACANPQDVLQNLMNVREPIYKRASMTLDSSDKDQQKAMDDILHNISCYLNKRHNGA